MDDDRIPLSRKGMENLENELRHLQNEKRPVVAKQVEEHRAQGDLKENAPYHAAREELAMIDTKVKILEDKLSRGYLVERSQLPDDMIVFGTRVELKNADSGEKETYELVGDGEEDSNNNRILTTSPLGEALMLGKVGDVVEFEAPGGKFTYEVLSICFIEE